MNTENKAVDATANTGGFNIVHLPLVKLHPFKDHAFKVYEGARMDRMVQSIRDNDVIQPIVVRLIEGTDEYEIISGHNRAKATELLGLAEIPAIVYVLTDDEAVMVANATNISQRTFKEWLPSEKAKSIHQYHEAIKRQGERTDLVAETSGAKRQKSDDGHARKKTAQVYGESEYTIRLYLELFRLIAPLLERFDGGQFGVTSAQRLSYISPEGQALVNSVLDEYSDTCCVTVINSQIVRLVLKDYPDESYTTEDTEVVRENVRIILSNATPPAQEQGEFETIKIKKEQYVQLFSDKDHDDVVEEIIVAVEYRRNSFVQRSSMQQKTATVSTAASSQEYNNDNNA